MYSNTKKSSSFSRMTCAVAITDARAASADRWRRRAAGGGGRGGARRTSFSFTMFGWLSFLSDLTSRSAMHSSHE